MMYACSVKHVLYYQKDTSTQEESTTAVSPSWLPHGDMVRIIKKCYDN